MCNSVTDSLIWQCCASDMRDSTVDSLIQHFTLPSWDSTAESSNSVFPATELPQWMCFHHARSAANGHFWQLHTCEFQQWTASSSNSMFPHARFCSRQPYLQILGFCQAKLPCGLHHLAFHTTIMWHSTLYILPSCKIPQLTASFGRPFCASIMQISTVDNLHQQIHVPHWRDSADDSLFRQFHASIMRDSAEDGFIHQFHAFVIRDFTADVLHSCEIPQQTASFSNSIFLSGEILQLTTTLGHSVLPSCKLQQQTYFCLARLHSKWPLEAKLSFCISIMHDSTVDSIQQRCSNRQPHQAILHFCHVWFYIKQLQLVILCFAIHVRLQGGWQHSAILCFCLMWLCCGRSHLVVP